eukprot:TRINITY_DN4585_c0_g1_i1.p1 TRINITY_DN4585_c0_g1~~TRINITY_DN4585_c0_g1_i1.p1  ORF type:complete len:150 (+),score=29.50 TRINITY_DN4585_c0_g1_i1:24-452(+)
MDELTSDSEVELKEAEKACSRAWKQGYVEGVDKGKEAGLQEGFDQGFVRCVTESRVLESSSKRGSLSAIEFILRQQRSRGLPATLLERVSQLNQSINASIDGHQFRIDLGESDNNSSPPTHQFNREWEDEVETVIHEFSSTV